MNSRAKMCSQNIYSLFGLWHPSIRNLSVQREMEPCRPIIFEESVDPSNQASGKHTEGPIDDRWLQLIMQTK